MKLRENRDEIVLATKYTSSWQLANPKVKIQSNFGGNNKKALISAFEASLKRLQTNYVDLVSLQNSRRVHKIGLSGAKNSHEQ